MEALMQFVAGRLVIFSMTICVMGAAAALYYPTPSNVFAAVEALGALEKSFLCDERVGFAGRDECREASHVLQCDERAKKFFMAADVMHGNGLWLATRMANDQTKMLVASYGQVDCSKAGSSSPVVGNVQLTHLAQVERE